jgi:hypothetical protein
MPRGWLTGIIFVPGAIIFLTPDVPLTDSQRFDCPHVYGVRKLPCEVIVFNIGVRHEEKAHCLELAMEGTVL